MTNASVDLSQFKVVPGGFAYRAVHPWLFGPAKHYFVTGPQRDEILALSEQPTARRAFTWMMAMIVVAVGVTIPFLWYRHGYRFDPLTAGDVAILMVATLLAMLVAIKITLNPLIKRLEPLLVTLPRTDQKISITDYNRSLLKLSTTTELRKRGWLFIALGAITGFNVIFTNHFVTGFMSSNVVWTIELAVAVVLSAVGVLHLWRAMQRSEQ